MKLFPKFFLLLTSLAAVPLMVTALVMRGEAEQLQEQLQAKNQQIGQDTSIASQRALENQARLTHQQIVQEKVAQLDAFFTDLRRAVLLESTLAQSALSFDAPRTPLPLYTGNEVAEWLKNPESEFTRATYAQKAYCIYHLAPGADAAAVQNSLDRLSQLGYFFAHNQRALPWCMSTYFGHKDGFILGYPGRSAYAPTYDPRVRPWYTSASAVRRLTWTPLYLDRNEIDFVMTCANPVYNAQAPEQLLGVAAIDVNLNQILEQLFNLRGLPVTEAVLVDGDGRVQVSAAYGRQQVDIRQSRKTNATLSTADIGDFQHGDFAPVFEQVRRAGASASGILSMRNGRAASAAEIIEARDGALFAYGRILLTGEETGVNEQLTWYYIVKMPVDLIIQPVQDIRVKMDKSQQDLTLEIAEKIESLWVQVLVITIGVLVAAMGTAWWMARSITRPLVELAAAAERVGQGDLDQSVKIHSRDEIGQVGQSINHMIKGLKERDFIKSTFKRYVAASVVDHLIQDPDKIKLGGEKREMTVFFSDLVGFTTTAEHLPPETLVVLINEYLGAMTESIFAHEGTVDKYIGDAIMAFWGAPVASHDHALRACKAALHNIAALRKLWPSWEARGLPLFDVRIGINTGPMVVGNMGSSVMMGYTVMGDAVNLGSRLEGANKGYGTRIMISEFTLAVVQGFVEVRELDLITVAGKTKAVRVYELLGLKGDIAAEARLGYDNFEKGLAAYRRQAWDEAEMHLRNALVRLPGDLVSQLFLKRIADYRQNPPPSDWDGVHTLTGK